MSINWTMISNISAFVTCLLFIFYILGRIWELFNKTKYISTSLSIDFDESIENIDVFDLVADETATEVVLLNSTCNIASIRIYNVYYDMKKQKLLRGANYIDYKKNIPANSVLRIRCVVPEGIPINQVIVTREDGLQEIFEIGADGTNVGNGVSIEGYRIRVTVLACIYQILK